MKNMTLMQRLNTALMLLSILLIVCVGLALWIEKEHSRSAFRDEQLTEQKERVERDLVLLGYSLRGVLLDPKPQGGNEIKPGHEPQLDVRDDLKKNLAEICKLTDHPTLVSAAKNLHDFVIGPMDNFQGTLGAFQARVLEMANTDPAAAVAYYNTNQRPIEIQLQQLQSALAGEIDQVKIAGAIRDKNVALGGSAGIMILLIASVLVGFLQSSAITQPLNRLVSTMERLRQGDFTQRLALERRDEFGVLSEGLNRLADDLSALVGQVQRSGIQVNTTATEIAASAKEQQSTAHEIAATTAQIGATSKEISATSKELVKTMNEVSQVAEETANVAGSGQTAIARMEANMRQIMEASGSISAKLAVLNEKTANINSVVTTITKVADQTNLLSLNAAIEAEKAGEYGLGFAVVAMEIRRLADQTAVATYDIEKMVKEMQSAVAAGVMGMDKFSEEVRRGVEEIRQVSTHLAQIIHQVQTLTPRFQTVNEGMHAQATGAQQISETLTQLTEAAQQTAESLRQSNQAIDQLNNAARGLQTSVARFKLVN